MKLTENWRPLAVAALVCTLGPAGCRSSEDPGAALETARSHHDRGELAEAEIGYKNILKRHPREARAMAGLGRIWLDRGVPLEAVHLLSRAHQSLPGDPEVAARFAQALAAAGYLGQAREVAEAALAEDASNETALRVLAETSFTEEQLEETRERLEQADGSGGVAVELARAVLAARAGDAAAASAAVNRALAIDPEEPLAHGFRARLLQAAGDPAGALAASTRALRSAGPRSPVRLQHATLLAAADRQKEAAAFLRETTEAAPDFVPAWRLRARLALAADDRDSATRYLEKVAEWSPLDLEAGVMEAELALSDGEAGKALERMIALREAHPPQPSLEYLLALAYQLDGNGTLAREAFGRTLELDPGHSGATLALARMTLQRGEPAAAAELLEPLVERHPDSGGAQLLLAEAYRGLGRAGEASALLEKRTGGGQDDFPTYLQLGMALRGADQPDKARAAFERANELEPDHLLVTAQLVSLDVSENKFREAHERVSDHLERAPEAAGAHLLRAMIHEEEGNFGEAETSALEAIRLEPNLLPAYMLLVRVHEATGATGKALEDLARLVERAPHDAAALMRLGALQQGLGRRDEARESYERLLRAHPDFAPALNNLAVLLTEDPDQLARAHELASRARSQLPADPAVADTLGWIHFRRGEYGRALSLLERAARELPGDAEVQFHHGMAAYMMDRREDAEAAFARALESASDFSGRSEAETKLARLRDPRDPETLRRIVAEEPDDLVARLQLAGQLAAGGEAEEAARQYEAVVGINPSLVPAWMKLAELFAGPLDRADEALEAARRARELAPDDRDAAALIGRIAYAAGDHVWAHGLLEESASGREAPPDLLWDAGWAAYSLGRVPEARAKMEDLVARAPDTTLAEDARRFLRWTEESPPAGADLPDAPPDFLPARFAAALALEEEGKAGEAEQALEEILRDFPKFSPAQKALARVILKRGGATDDAKEWLVQARETLRDDPEVHSLLGRIAWREGDSSYATQLLRQAESLGRTLAPAENFALGMALLEQDQPDEARPLLERALAAGLDEADAAAAREALQEPRSD